jgi:beta-lactam-binding protein with PASTA domain
MTPVAHSQICPACKNARPADEDFCGQRLQDGSLCGTFLAWSAADQSAATDIAAQVAEPQAAAPKATGRAVVTVDVTVDGLPSRADGLLLASAPPGGRARLTARVRNIGEQVRTFKVEVRGDGGGLQLPEEWVRISDADLYLELNPSDHPGPSDGTATIVLEVPLDNSRPAGDYGFAVAVRADDDRGDFPSVVGTLTVEPRIEAIASVTPLIARGRRTTQLSVVVHNIGNTPITPVLKLSDAQQILTFPLWGEAAPPDPLAHPIAELREQLAARVAANDPRHPAGPADTVTATPAPAIAPDAEEVYTRIVYAPLHVIGIPIDHQIKIEPSVPGGRPIATQHVIFRQAPLIPWWLIPAVVLLAAIALMLYELWPRPPHSDIVKMPVLVGLTSEFQAEQRMAQAGLSTVPEISTRIDPGVRVGTVLAQIPLPNVRIEPSHVVTLSIAEPPSSALVPDLAGFTWLRARTVLESAHLALGDVAPSKNSRRPVVLQSPRAGLDAPRGTAVDVVLAGPAVGRVPNVRCLTAAAAEKRLSAHSFRLAPVPATLDPAALVSGQIPGFGTHEAVGQDVQVLFTGGKPCPAKNIAAAGGTGTTGTTGATGATATTSSVTAGAGAVAFDDGHDILVSGRNGSLAAGREAAWSPDGGLLALRSGRQLAIRRVSSSGSTRVATFSIPGAIPSMPAFAPGLTGSRSVLAFLATPPGGLSQICVAAVGSAPIVAPGCRALPGIRARALAWSADARTLLVVGSRPAAASVVGIVSLTSATPAAGIGQWHTRGGLVRPMRDGRLGSVFDIAVDARTGWLALTTDLGSNGQPVAPQVVLTPSDTLPSLAGADWLGVSACQVTWSPDGTRIAAIQPPVPGTCDDAGFGSLVSFAVTTPGRVSELAPTASTPAWRPTPLARTATAQP